MMQTSAVFEKNTTCAVTGMSLLVQYVRPEWASFSACAFPEDLGALDAPELLAAGATERRSMSVHCLQMLCRREWAQ